MSDTDNSPGSGAITVANANAPAAITTFGEMTGAQKALAFVLSVDEPVATRILSFLHEDQVELLRRTSEVTHEVEPRVVASVHREFLTRVKQGVPTSLQGSGSYLRRLVGNALGEGKAAALWDGSKGGTIDDGTPFGVISATDPTLLATLLEREEPETVAIVLSQLESERAGALLGLVPAEQRVKMIRALLKLESVPEDAIESISRELREQVERIAVGRETEIAGKDVAARMLKRLAPDAQQQTLDDLATMDEAAAATLRQALFTFEDLLRVDSRGMQQVLKEVATPVLVLALKTASEDLREKIFGNLSSRAADMLREELDALGPTRVKDVQEAQQTIVDAALELERGGRITIAREGGADFV